MVKIEPDILAEVTFLKSEEGGRKFPTAAGDFHSCLFLKDSKYYDCRLVLEKIGKINPGDKLIVPIKFLSPRTKLMMKQDDKFELWEGKVVAHGKIVNKDGKK